MSTGALHTFYCSKKWKLFRNTIISDRSKDGCFCEKCNRLILKDEEIHIHHTPIELTENNYTDASISLNPENVKMVCKSCHDEEHSRFCKGSKRKTYTRHIVCGPPLAGKRTYVEKNLTTGDLIVDIDKLYYAMSGKQIYDKPDNLKYNVLAVKNTIIEQVERCYGNFKGVWIIGTYPNEVEREQLANRLGAEIVLIKPSKEECIERLHRCADHRSKHIKEYSKYIEDWFEKYC